MNPYSIKEITLRRCRLNLTRTNRYSSGGVDPMEIPSIIVQITLAGGAPSGWGEWIPTSILYEPGHIGRSGIEEWEVAQRTAQSLIGKDARLFRTWLSEELQSEDANSLVDGFDFALHDAVARTAGWSVQQLMGGGRPYVQGMALLHLDEPDATAELAAKLFAEGGYRWYKLKPSCETERDYETLVKIRERLPVDVRFFIDPNYCLRDDIDFAVSYLNKLASAGLHVCEDPIPFNIERYRAIQERTDVKIMVDERARTFEQVIAAGKAGCARMINIHANWASGFVRGLRRAEIAAAFGMEAIIGSVRYLGIGTAAYQTLSSIFPFDTPCEQINDDEYVVQCVVKKRYETRDGKIFIPQTPGLGIEPEPETLDELTVEKHSYC